MSAGHSDLILQRMMALHPKIIDLTLDRMHRILAALGDPHRQIPPAVLIAGTNGKGSTLAMIRAGLEGAGRTVHAYTSPHLARFHERIVLSGRTISEPDLTAVLAECEAVNDDLPITYFEITTAAAFLAFSRAPADHTLLEVGLGGRMDATNVIRPDLTVITPVSMDHQQYLGDTLPEIAGEKAGIMKRAVPCVVGPQAPEALEVIEARAAEVGAPLLVANQDWQVWEEHGRIAYQDAHGLLDLPLPNLIGAHQVQNAGCALAALRVLGAGDPDAAVTRAVWPARMQRLREGPLIEIAGPGAELWLDGGHNPAAGACVAEALSRLPARPLHVVCGMLKTKDARGYMAHFGPLADSFRTVAIPGETATLTAEDAAAAARSAGLRRVETAPDLATAVRDAVGEEPGARILICGSLYLAGTVLRDHA